MNLDCRFIYMFLVPIQRNSRKFTRAKPNPEGSRRHQTGKICFDDFTENPIGGFRRSIVSSSFREYFIASASRECMGEKRMEHQFDVPRLGIYREYISQFTDSKWLHPNSITPFHKSIYQNRRRASFNRLYSCQHSCGD